MFTESQNLKYCGDIIEQILIIIFSKVFETGKDNTINKYIFNNLLLINERGNYEFFNWIKNESLCKDEFNNLEKLFDIDGTEEEVTGESLQRQKDSIFYNISLQYIFMTKEKIKICIILIMAIASITICLC